MLITSCHAAICQSVAEVQLTGMAPLGAVSHRLIEPIGKRPLGKPTRRWEDNIRIDLQEMGIITKNWVDSAQNRDYWRTLVNAALNLRVS